MRGDIDDVVSYVAFYAFLCGDIDDVISDVAFWRYVMTLMMLFLM